MRLGSGRTGSCDLQLRLRVHPLNLSLVPNLPLKQCQMCQSSWSYLFVSVDPLNLLRQWWSWGWWGLFCLVFFCPKITYWNVRLGTHSSFFSVFLTLLGVLRVSRYKTPRLSRRVVRSRHHSIKEKIVRFYGYIYYRKRSMGKEKSCGHQELIN